MVVDLAIYNGRDGLGGIVEWLIAGRGKVVDLEAGVAETFFLLADQVSAMQHKA